MVLNLLRRFVLVWAILALATAAAHGDKRVALVVGNALYQHAPSLANADNDAAAMTMLFKNAGFDVVETRRDIGILELRRALRDFSDQARDSDMAVIYYAGHGIEVEGTNYLIPVDARLASDFDVEDETVSLDRIVRVLEPAKRLRLVILDACRENPFAKTMKRTIGTRAIGRGLARVEPATSDTLIAFAAKAGAVAEDGDGSNSPFTAALVRHLTMPGLDLRLAFGQVRDEVMKKTNNRQEPFVYGSLGGSTVALVPAPVVPVDPNAEARLDYEFAAQIGTKEAWDAFLAAHAGGLYADLARAQSSKLDAASQASAKAEQARRQAEEEARQAEDAKRQSGERAMAQLEDARRQLEESRRQADEARRQVEEARRQAVEDARRMVEDAKRQADEERAKTVVATAPASADIGAAPAAVAPVMDPGDVARLLQAHLKRVGCDPGTTDGNWGDGSRKALEEFNRHAGTRFDGRLASLDALDAVRARTERVCPLVCGRGQREDGDRCVQITCGAGLTLGSDGTCRKRRELATRPTPRHEPRGASGESIGGKCFTFSGKRFCE